MKVSSVKSVQRINANGMWPAADPFLFTVYHKDNFPAGNGKYGIDAKDLRGRNIGSDFSAKDGWSMYHGDMIPGFPSHPHRGFETITVVRDGVIDHSDSLGSSGRFSSGDTQWMTAGKGVVHCEMFPLVNTTDRNPTDFFQIWLNLPAANKMVDPHFKMLWNEKIPKVTHLDDAGKSTVVSLTAGTYGGETPPSPPPESWAYDKDNDVAIWTITMSAGATWTLPKAALGDAVSRYAFFFRGNSISVDDKTIAAPSMITLLGSEDAVIVNTDDSEVELLLLQGKPINEPVAKHGPFVMNTDEELNTAFSDYSRTKFGGWPWADDTPVFGDKGRFANHGGGKVEYPEK